MPSSARERGLAASDVRVSSPTSPTVGPSRRWRASAGVYFSALGFAPPRLQVPLPGPNGERLRVEFGLDEFDAWGECDGDGKYHDRSQNGGRTAEQVFAAEKRREDWIRATTGRRFVRWGASDLTDLDTFEAFLRRRGLVSRHPWRPMPW